MSEDKKVFESGIHTNSRDLMSDWYKKLAEATKAGRHTAYLMISGNCVEILRAFDIEPIFPEVNALQWAIRKQSLPLILKAEEHGYSSDNCAYVKADMGYFFTGGIGEKGSIPKPSLVLCNFVGCNVYIKWFEHSARFLGSPLYMLDIPFVREEMPSRDD
ncbi:2-hydroxyacyl-CoA dehydratase, partial [Candidatus Peregrinibacteria bacterium]|nr:2-hydroxyacyl-CoA dehydratase [Candidatus Peregrinibacteria bacterium]